MGDGTEVLHELTAAAGGHATASKRNREGVLVQFDEGMVCAYIEGEMNKINRIVDAPFCVQWPCEGDRLTQSALGGGWQPGGMQQTSKLFVVWTYAGDNVGDSADALSEVDAFFSGDGTTGDEATSTSEATFVVAPEGCDSLSNLEDDGSLEYKGVVNDKWDILDEYDKMKMQLDTHMPCLKVRDPDEEAPGDGSGDTTEVSSEIKLTRTRRRLRLKNTVLRGSTGCSQSVILRSRRATKGKWRTKKAGC